MICPACKASGTYTYDSRKHKDPIGFFYVERRRRCADATCDHRFTTIEVDSELFSQLTFPKQEKP